MTDEPKNGESHVKRSEQQKCRPVPGYQASPEEQTWFARTYSSDIVIMPVAPRQRSYTTPKKADEPEVLLTINRDGEA